MYLGRINDKKLGPIDVYSRQGMVSTNFRYEDGVLKMHVPTGLGSKRIYEIIEEMRPRLEVIVSEEANSSFRYHEGQVIPCLGYTITIERHNLLKRVARYYARSSDLTQLVVDVWKEADLSDLSVTKLISSCITELIKVRAPLYLIDFAEGVARKKGVTPKRFVIGRGLRKLGHCTRSNEILLSYNLMLLPEDLAEYIICHELAHIAEKNHSPRFHAECDRLCGGRERELEQRLRAFTFPVLP